MRGAQIFVFLPIWEGQKGPTAVGQWEVVPGCVYSGFNSQLTPLPHAGGRAEATGWHCSAHSPGFLSLGPFFPLPRLIGWDGG